MDEIILIGSGGHARSCIDVIELSKQYKIAGLVEKDNADFHRNHGYPVIGTDNDLPDLRKKYEFALVTVGQIKSTSTRIILFEMLSDLDYKLPVIVSPRSYVNKHCKIGVGTIITHDVIVNAYAIIGKNCIINNKALIEHDAVVGDHCHIATGAILNGEVQVGKGTFIGSGVVTRQRVIIGKNCVIGAGSVIKDNLTDSQIVK